MIALAQIRANFSNRKAAAIFARIKYKSREFHRLNGIWTIHSLETNNIQHLVNFEPVSLLKQKNPIELFISYSNQISFFVHSFERFDTEEFKENLKLFYSFFENIRMDIQDLIEQ